MPAVGLFRQHQEHPRVLTKTSPTASGGLLLCIFLLSCSQLLHSWCSRNGRWTQEALFLRARRYVCFRQKNWCTNSAICKALLMEKHHSDKKCRIYLSRGLSRWKWGAKMSAFWDAKKHGTCIRKYSAKWAGSIVTWKSRAIKWKICYTMCVRSHLFCGVRLGVVLSCHIVSQLLSFYPQCRPQNCQLLLRRCK